MTTRDIRIACDKGTPVKTSAEVVLDLPERDRCVFEFDGSAVRRRISDLGAVRYPRRPAPDFDAGTDRQDATEVDGVKGNA